ncbi:FeoA family protein [Pelagicoccus sp. SDUM812003]|uniref:FeoA family protein n=1 Tax=Pelagicoccus sp. SDUM812003 TaxID=3041267 RepID=UPI00280F3166|nr:FeoA family protein [Pelagicoccus sp. SDUM812003]MDQ8203442.1 FeoA family protein [Pelagicoccus sp. SDUM812003]
MKLKTLNDLTQGQSARISCYMPRYSAARRLMELGLMPGVTVRFVKTAPLGDPIALEVEGRHFSLRRQDAAQISVQSI